MYTVYRFIYGLWRDYAFFFAFPPNNMQEILFGNFFGNLVYTVKKKNYIDLIRFLHSFFPFSFFFLRFTQTKHENDETKRNGERLTTERITFLIDFSSFFCLCFANCVWIKKYIKKIYMYIPNIIRHVCVVCDARKMPK